MIHVKNAQYVDGYKIKIRFSDDVEGIVDLSNCFDGTVFEPLKDITYFQKFTVDQEIRTIVWPNGADFAPAYLKDHLLN